VGIINFRGECTVKLISQLLLVGVFFCGTLGQAITSHPRLLSFDQLMQLNTAQRADYIKTIREAFLAAESAQDRVGISPQARNEIPHLPNFTNPFYSEALAQEDFSQYCIYAGNISDLKANSKCHALISSDACPDPKAPTLCNTFLFGNNVCVPVPSKNIL